MKSLTAVCQTGASMPAIHPNGRITRHPPHRGDGENAEMKMYLSKLKDLVPFMPKNRKLSKLEIIQHVIDYICDLQSELETHPEMNNFDASAALTFNNSNNNNSSPTQQQQQAESEPEPGQQFAEGNGGNSSGERSPVAMQYNNLPSDTAERLTANSSDNGAGIETQPPQSMLIADGVAQRSSLLSCSVSVSGNGIRKPLADRHAPNTILPAQSNNLADNATMTALPQQNLNDLARRSIFTSAAQTITNANTQAITAAANLMHNVNSMDAVSTIDDNNSLQRLVSRI